MLTIIVGASGHGKTTLAGQISSPAKPLVSASMWIRTITGIQGHSADDVEALTASAKARLMNDPRCASVAIEAEVRKSASAVVDGVRNPVDLCYLVSSGDEVIDVGGVGVTAWERDGLTAIRAMRPFLELQLGVRWLDYQRRFAAIPQPIACALPNSFLRADHAAPGMVGGELVALESYEGQPITGCWVSRSGGSFHDVPIDRLALDEDRIEGCGFPESVYSKADAGAAVIERSTLAGPVSVFDRQRNFWGIGNCKWMVHWPEGNQLLHLVHFRGQLLLWPPHKLLRGRGFTLPSWKKLK